MNPAMKETRLIVLVTDADSTCGSAISQHLLSKLSGTAAPDASLNKPTFPWFPEFSPSNASPFNPAGTYPAVDALTLILASRRRGKAEEARARLLQDFEKRVVARYERSAGRSAGSQACSFTASFARRLRLEAAELDVASPQSVSTFTEVAKDRYSYLSHIFFVNSQTSSDINNCTSVYYTLSPLLQACPLPPSRVLWIDDTNDPTSVQVTAAVSAYLDVQAGLGVGVGCGERANGHASTQIVKSGLRDSTNQDLKRRTAAAKKAFTRVRHFAVYPGTGSAEPVSLSTSSVSQMKAEKSATPVSSTPSYLGKFFTTATTLDTAASAARLALTPYLLLPSPPPGDPAMASNPVSIDTIIKAAARFNTNKSSSAAGLRTAVESKMAANKGSNAWIVGAH